MTDSTVRQPRGIPVGGQFASASHAEPALDLSQSAEAAAAAKAAEEDAAWAALDDDQEDRTDFGWDGPGEEDPMSPEDREQWNSHHRFAYAYAHGVLGVTGFEDRDTIERFAGFAADAYQESGWNGMMDIHGVVDDWMAQERPLG